jgi:hypothetical protein
LRDSSLGIIRTSPGTTYAIWIDHDDSVIGRVGDIAEVGVSLEEQANAA